MKITIDVPDEGVTIHISPNRNVIGKSVAPLKPIKDGTIDTTRPDPSDNPLNEWRVKDFDEDGAYKAKPKSPYDPYPIVRMQEHIEIKPAKEPVLITRIAFSKSNYKPGDSILIKGVLTTSERNRNDDIFALKKG